MVVRRASASSTSPTAAACAGGAAGRHGTFATSPTRGGLSPRLALAPAPSPAAVVPGGGAAVSAATAAVARYGACHATVLQRRGSHSSYGGGGTTRAPSPSGGSLNAPSSPPLSAATSLPARAGTRSPPAQPCCVSPRRLASSGSLQDRGSASGMHHPRGLSPKALSPKCSLSPERSVSPPPGPALQRGVSSTVGRISPHLAPPFNTHTDFDIIVELPPEVSWFRFEALVGFADWATDSWVTGMHAKFVVFDEDAQLLYWESSDTLEPWAPTELCSFLLPGAGDVTAGGTGAPAAPAAPRRLCLRVSCSMPPVGALWIDPVVTALQNSLRSCLASDALPEAMFQRRREVLDRECTRPWVDILLGELAHEVAANLQCREFARLLCACSADGALQQLCWHFVFMQSFRSAYVRYFVRPLQGQPRPATLPRMVANPKVTAAKTRPSARLPSFMAGQTAGGQTSPRWTAASGPGAGRGFRHAAGLPPSSPPGRSPPPHPALATGSGSASTAGAGTPAAVPLWVLEVFDWRQICRRFYLAQLLCISVNFQMCNCTTPAGFVKDFGETFRSSAKGAAGHGPHQSTPGHSSSLRCGWNVPLGTECFLSRASAVVAHRSPLGVAGMPPHVATVRGTAGPEPLAMTPMVSERDSSVVLPQAPHGQHGHLRPQWTLEVEPGRYLVVVTVGDKNVGFAANLEVGGLPLFGGEWNDAGTFKSKCLLCVALRGAITVGPHWPPSRVAGEESWQQAPVFCSSELCSSGGLSPGGSEVKRVESPRSQSPARTHSPLGGPRAGGHSPPRSSKPTDGVAKGTRLVSLRVVSATLAREVARERQWALSEPSCKNAEPPSEMRSPRGPAAGLDRMQSKHVDLQTQKVLKLCSVIAMSKRVSHPYIYLNGEAHAAPPTNQAAVAPAAELERPQGS